MVELPALSAPTQRKLKLKWLALLDANKFDGTHLRWRESDLVRCARIQTQAAYSSSASPVGSMPDKAGIPQSVEVARQRLRDLAEVYLPFWRAGGEGYEQFEQWLDVLVQQVIGDLELLWSGTSLDLDDWWARACLPALKGALGHVKGELVRAARAEELRRLDRPVRYSELEDRYETLIAKAREALARSRKGPAGRDPVSPSLESLRESNISPDTQGGNGGGISGDQTASGRPRSTSSQDVAEGGTAIPNQVAAVADRMTPVPGSSEAPPIPCAQQPVKGRHPRISNVAVYPKRAAWLKEMLRRRSWNKYDLWRNHGPDAKTTAKILSGFPVREDVLSKVAEALSQRGGAVTVLDIPQE